MPIKKTSAKKIAKSGSAQHAVRALPGKSGKGKELDPLHESLEAMSASLMEVRESRPYLSRYPIPDQRFIKIKEAAHRLKLAKKNATIAKDAGTKSEVSAVAV